MRLQLTRRGDYAIRAALALAALPDRRVLSARALSDRMSIPGTFVPQVLGDLARAGLVIARPGRNGGYRLARSADRITLLEVVEAVEGDSRRASCVLRGGPCRADGTCAVHEVFFGAQEALLEKLGTATLAQIANDT